MSKKHFVAAAKELRGERKEFERRFGPLAFEETVKLFARVFRGDNPRFDSGRFNAAVFGE